MTKRWFRGLGLCALAAGLGATPLLGAGCSGRIDDWRAEQRNESVLDGLKRTRAENVRRIQEGNYPGGVRAQSILATANQAFVRLPDDNEENEGIRPSHRPAPSATTFFGPSTVTDLAASSAGLRVRVTPHANEHGATTSVSASGARVKVTATAPGGVALAADLVGASATAAPALVDGYLVYPAVFEAAPDVHMVRRVFEEGAEDFFVYPKRPAVEELTYRVTLDPSVAGLRLVEGTNTLEFLARDGTPHLRINPPEGMDADGKVFPIAITVESCQVDSSPALPYGRATLDPGGRTCDVHFRWTSARYPVAIDPAFTATGSMSKGRFMHSSAVVGTNRVIVFGASYSAGDSTAEIYDFATGTWSVAPPVPFVPCPGAGYHSQLHLPDGRPMALEYNGSRRVAAYDGATNTWAIVATMPTALSATIAADAAVQLQNGDILTYNGSRFTALTQTWSVAPSVPSGGPGFFVAYGGTLAMWVNNGAAFKYSTNTNTYVALPGVGFQTGYSGGVILTSGKVLVSGQYPSTGKCSIFDPGPQTWSMCANQISHQIIEAGVATLPTGAFYVGVDYAGTTLGKAETYDTASNTWTVNPLPYAAADFPAVTSLPDGRVLLSGGMTRQDSGVGFPNAAIFGCHVNADCGVGGVCVITSGVVGSCRTPCTSDAQCSGSLPACNVASGACVQCTVTNTTQCVGQTPTCNVNTNLCVAGCTKNACGGCAVLGNAPGSACGNCGTYACNGVDAVVCNGDHALNACGGCGALPNQPGAACGNCGTYACNGPNAVVCAGDHALNACGGCGTLPSQPGAVCGNCGTYACNGVDAVVCNGDHALNACGGCGALANQPGAACGSCGTYACNGPNAVACAGDHALNACGGCGTLPNQPGAVCGVCRTYACNGVDAIVCGPVVDHTPPTIICPVAVTTTTAVGTCGATPSLGLPTASDDCSIASVISNSPGTFGLGATLVTWTATDGSGNTASCTQTVTVVDAEKPTIACPADITAHPDPHTCTALVKIGSAITGDNCSVKSTTNDAPAGGIFVKGATVVTWTVVDGSGNSAACTQTINVVPRAPVTQCLAPTVAADAMCLGYASVDDKSYAPDDNLASCTQTAGPYHLGANTVTLACTDLCGDTTSCTTTVTIKDTTPPAITCPANEVLECIDNGAIASFMPTATDNCSVASVTCAPASGSKFPRGLGNPDTCTAVDGSGNTKSCGFTIDVIDTKAPVVTTKDVTIYEDVKGAKAEGDHSDAEGCVNPTHTFAVSDCITSIADQCDGTLTASGAAVITRVEWWTYIETGDKNDAHKVSEAREKALEKFREAGCGDYRISADGKSVGLPVKELDDLSDDAGSYYVVFFSVADKAGNVSAGSCKVNIKGEPPVVGDHGGDEVHGDHGEVEVPLGCTACTGTGCELCPTPPTACYPQKDAGRCAAQAGSCQAAPMGKACQKYQKECLGLECK